jgi:transposase
MQCADGRWHGFFPTSAEQANLEAHMPQKAQPTESTKSNPTSISAAAGENGTPNPALATKIGVTKIAIDMHLKNFRVVRQLDHSQPQPAQKFSPEKFYPWLSKQIALSEKVVVCYEAGCFGDEPARRMQTMGSTALVIAPQNWDEQQKRQVNDTVDAQVICRRLSDYLDGHRHARSVVHIPSREEEELRAKGRLRVHLRKEMRRLQSRGRSLLLQTGIAIKGRWWSGKLWEEIKGKAKDWLLQELEIWKRHLEAMDKDARAVEKELVQAAPKDLFFGQGELSYELITRELMDPQRFKNRRQLSNYLGLCPSESTSDTKRRLGSITKRGNPRLRHQFVELAWRTLRFQPPYRGVKKWVGALTGPSPAQRKKAIVALARTLAVDLWRVATGRSTYEALGLSLTKSV